MMKPSRPDTAIDVTPYRAITPEEIVKKAFNDNVNHPSHYETGNFECIDVMAEVFGDESLKEYCLINTFKYLYRCKRKNNMNEDVKKAIWYLNKYVELEEGDQGE